MISKKRKSTSLAPKTRPKASKVSALTNQGSGAIATSGSAAAGEGSIAVVGNVDGTIVLAQPGATVSINQAARSTRFPELSAWPIPMPPRAYFAHPYPLQSHFTGRFSERKTLTNWLTENRQPIFVLTAIGGMGKSAASWVWLQEDVFERSAPSLPGRSQEFNRDSLRSPKPYLEGVLWWSFYERDASFTSFVNEALIYVSRRTINPEDISSSSDKVKTLLELLTQRRFLIILDGFERELHAFKSLSVFNTKWSDYDEADSIFRSCVDTRASEFLRGVASLRGQSQVLITSRYLPYELDNLEGVQREDLAGLGTEESISLFRAHNIHGTRAEILALCRAHGYHPLSLRLLVGVIVKDKQRPGDVQVMRHNLIFMQLKGKEKHHIFQTAYDSLGRQNRSLLSNIACFRGPMPYSALAIFNSWKNLKRFDAALEELIQRNLLVFDVKLGRFDLHPLVRQYAYSRLNRSILETVHHRLRSYFKKLSASRINDPKTSEELSDLIEYYYHTVKSGRYTEAYKVFHDKLFESLHYRFGEYHTNIELLGNLFPFGEHKPPRLRRMLLKTWTRGIHTGTAFPPRLGYESAQVWALTALGISYRAIGSPKQAEPLFRMANSISEQLGDIENLVIGLINLSDVQWTLGEFKVVDHNLRQQIALSKSIGSEAYEIVGHQDLGLRLAFRGRWSEADAELGYALQRSLERKDVHRQAIIWAHWARKELLLARALNSKRTTRKALVAALRIMNLLGNNLRERHYVRACWLTGAAYLRNGNLDQAQHYLQEALAQCRRINIVEFESDILLEMARFWLAKREQEVASKYAYEALSIAERCSFVLAEADAYLLISTIERQNNNRDLALKYAERAYEYAECDGAPDYVYKVAYDESNVILDELGQNRLLR
jgi:tetratricopeptide (TPR) repeat protein